MGQEKLGSDVASLRSSYGVVVLGSGYGGSVVAARLAAAGHDVAVFERGREWLPGTFPDEWDEAALEIRSKLNPNGLIDVHPGHDLDVVGGCGLGGGSLINASVAIRPEASVLQHERWPSVIRGEGLEADFARAEAGLEVEQPDAKSFGDAEPRKVSEFRAGAGSTYYVPLTVRLGPPTTNATGSDVPTCNGCGDCCSGCNVGAKKTLWVTYLARAKKDGASLFTELEARFVLPAAGGGYWVWLLHQPQGGPASERVVHARVVVVSAGAPGSAGVLLRSAERGLSVGPRVGHHFGSNADLAGFGYNTDHQTDVVGEGADGRMDGQGVVGPTILTATERHDRNGRRFLIEEGALPGALHAPFRAAAAFGGGVDTDEGKLDWLREKMRWGRDQVGRDAKGAVNHSLVYLGMGHDGQDGRVILDARGRPKVVWGAVGHREVFEDISAAMYGITEKRGGTYVRNPRWTKKLGRNPVTVHPLGGCPMGDDATRGAVDADGRVFQADGSPHEGLYVCDASVIPTSLGVNPFLTIAAVAERTARRMCERFPQALAGGEPGAPPEPPAVPVGIEFTEKMRGHVSRAVTDAPRDAKDARYLEGERLGREARTADAGPVDFRLTIVVDDLDRFLADESHEARCEGYVDGLFGRRQLVEEGRFNLFVAKGPKEKRMLYRLVFDDASGERLVLDGFKEIKDDVGFDVIEDTTTLFTTISRASDGAVVAQGVLHVGLADFVRQLSTMAARNASGLAEGTRALARFGKFFAGSLWETHAE